MQAGAIALTEPERQNIYRLRVQGLSLREIGEKVGRHFTVVRKYCAADGHDAKLATVRSMRAAIAHHRHTAPLQRMRLLRVTDRTLLAARDFCRHATPPVTTAALAAAVPGLAENDARAFLSVFWWLSRPISLRHRA
jgi:hypothetical protein